MPSQWPDISPRRLTAVRELSTKKGRRRQGAILLEGVRLVGEALTVRLDVECVLIADDAQGHRAAAQLPLQSPHVKDSVFIVSRTVFDKLADTIHAAGIATVVRWSPPSWPPQGDVASIRSVLVCDRISDPGNLGTLIRTAAGLGADCVILHPDCAELTNPKTLRATAGAVFRIPVYIDVPARVVSDWLRSRQLDVLVADAHAGASSYDVGRAGGWALVIGGETQPLDPVWRAPDVRRLRIPLARGVESLNAGVAGALLLDRLRRHVET